MKIYIRSLLLFLVILGVGIWSFLTGIVVGEQRMKSECANKIKTLGYVLYLQDPETGETKVMNIAIEPAQVKFEEAQ